MHSLALYVTNCLIDNKIADERQKDDYIYGLEVAFGKLVNYITLIAVAMYHNVLIPSLFFMMAFFSLRGRTGGFHARTALRCYIGTVGLYLLMVKYAIPFISGNLYFYIGIMAVSSIIIIAFAPLNHPALCLSSQEAEICKKSARRVLLLELACIGLAVLLDARTICIAYAVAGMGLDAILLCIAKMIGQEVKENEESE